MEYFYALIDIDINIFTTKIYVCPQYFVFLEDITIKTITQFLAGWLRTGVPKMTFLGICRNRKG